MIYVSNVAKGFKKMFFAASVAKKIQYYPHIGFKCQDRFKQTFAG